jgi:hypothetical protein
MMPLGETSGWWQTYATASGVYLWRTQVQGCKLQSPDDALAIVAAVGRTPHNLLDVRGIALRVSDDGVGQIDVVQTARLFATNTNVLSLWPNAHDVAVAVAADPSVAGRFPALVMTASEWLELVGPPDSVDFWRSAAVLWDRSLGAGDVGGPTQSYANRDGVYIGQADDGTRLRAWGGGKKPLGPDEPGGAVSSTTVILLLGGAAAAAALVWFLSRQQKFRGAPP